MADRPILFSAPMVRALLAGTKTQTRRISQKQDWPAGVLARFPRQEAGVPYRVGDRLWVREAWRTSIACDSKTPVVLETPGNGYGWPIWYGADEGEVTWRGADTGGPGFVTPGKRRSSLHMPRWASRLTLIVTDVRVQRLQGISREDAIAEGATWRPNAGWSMDWSRVGEPSRFAHDGKTLSERDVALAEPIAAFGSFINELHDPRWNHKGDGIFGENPWVVALTFDVVKANIDTLSQASPASGEALPVAEGPAAAHPLSSGQTEEDGNG